MMTIDKTRCVECGTCVNVCPAGIFRRDDENKVYPVRKDCIRCFHCAAACPTQAIGNTEVDPALFYPTPAPEGTLLARLQKRRSVRSFTPETPDRELIVSLLNGAAYVPSARNLHQNRWTVVLGADKVAELCAMILEWAADKPQWEVLIRRAAKGRDPLAFRAPCLILAHAPEDSPYAETNTVIAAAAAEQLLVDSGFGTCWGGYLCNIIKQYPALKEKLGIPDGDKVFAVLITGRSHERCPSIPYRNSADIHWVE